MDSIFKFKTDTNYAVVDDGIPGIFFGREGQLVKGKIVENRRAMFMGLIVLVHSKGILSLPAKDVEQVK